MKGYVNNAGKINLTTGQSTYFDVLECWGRLSSDSYFVLFNVKGQPRVVGGCSEYKNGECVELLSSQNHRRLGLGTVMLCVPVNAAGLAQLKEALGTKTVKFGTWD